MINAYISGNKAIDMYSSHILQYETTVNRIYRYKIDLCNQTIIKFTESRQLFDTSEIISLHQKKKTSFFDSITVN